MWSGFLSVSYCSKKCLSIKIEQFVAIFSRRGKALFKVANHTFELIFFLYIIPLSIYGFFLITLLLTGCSSIPLMHSRSMHRFRTRSMRIFMLRIQRI
ncbi:MAG: TRAP transporter small permease subunit [Eubacterium ramulus]